MSGLNIILGYDTKPDSYVGGIYLYWCLYEWIPLWGTILSLLFLSRTAMKNSTKKYARIQNQSNTSSHVRAGAGRHGPHRSSTSRSASQARPTGTTLDEENAARQSLLSSSDGGLEYVDNDDGPAYRSTGGTAYTGGGTMSSSGYYSNRYRDEEEGSDSDSARGDGDRDRDTGETRLTGGGYRYSDGSHSQDTKDIYSTPAREGGMSQQAQPYYSDITNNTPMHMNINRGGLMSTGDGNGIGVQGVGDGEGVREGERDGDGYSTQSGETLGAASQISEGQQSIGLYSDSDHYADSGLGEGMLRMRDTNDPQSMQFASELYNYDVQAAFQGGGYNSYRHSTTSYR